MQPTSSRRGQWGDQGEHWLPTSFCHGQHAVLTASCQRTPGRWELIRESGRHMEWCVGAFTFKNESEMHNFGVLWTSSEVPTASTREEKQIAKIWSPVRWLVTFRRSATSHWHSDGRSVTKVRLHWRRRENTKEGLLLSLPEKEENPDWRYWDTDHWAWRKMIRRDSPVYVEADLRESLGSFGGGVREYSKNLYRVPSCAIQFSITQRKRKNQE